ncbi:MAG: OsmC family protein [Ferruginibacter sp.]
MSTQLHTYKATIKWTGNRGEGTKNYKGYDRSHDIIVDDKDVIRASSDPAFMGDRSRHNPEELLVASLSSCHMLWFLHLCSDNGIVVVDYNDLASGTMVETSTVGYFSEVRLKPLVMITDGSKIERCNELHDLAHKHCFIANSCNFPVTHDPICVAI